MEKNIAKTVDQDRARVAGSAAEAVIEVFNKYDIPLEERDSLVFPLVDAVVAGVVIGLFAGTGQRTDGPENDRIKGQTRESVHYEYARKTASSRIRE